ncbi:MAG TPA: carbohydrate ABC transporter permease, partial [Rhodospirillales bacterium]|nr:carbohydrate ABC transporter permease [Rhodospirillales bacterium]
MSRNTKRKFARYSKYATLSVWAIIVAFPMYWVVATSFKPDRDWFAWPPVYWSEEPTLENYAAVWTDYKKEWKEGSQYSHSMQKPWKALRNSLFISLIST